MATLMPLVFAREGSKCRAQPPRRLLGLVVDVLDQSGETKHHGANADSFRRPLNIPAPWSADNKKALITATGVCYFYLRT